MSHLNVPQRGKGCLLASISLVVVPLTICAVVVVMVIEAWDLFAGALGVR